MGRAARDLRSVDPDGDDSLDDAFEDGGEGVGPLLFLVAGFPDEPGPLPLIR